jgi:hypothetical protein
MLLCTNRAEEQVQLQIQTMKTDEMERSDASLLTGWLWRSNGHKINKIRL